MTRKAITTAVALAFVAAGCTSDAPTAPEVMGSLTIGVAGFITAVPNGGIVRLVRTDIHRDTMWMFQLPGSGSLTVPMPLGTYWVGFDPPVSYTASLPAQVVTVQQAAEATDVTFGVTLTTGTLVINVYVNGPLWPKDGGTVSLVRTDIDGQSPQNVTILDAVDDYYGDFTVLPGTYSLSYSPPAGFAVAAGTPDHVSVHVAASGVVYVTFSMVPVPP